MLHSETAVSLVFPHQLFKEHPALIPGRRVYLIEEFLFFKQCKFHQQKLVLHRASMKRYEGFLKTEGFDVEYIDSGCGVSDIRELLNLLQKRKVREVHYCLTADDWLEKRITKTAGTNDITCVVYDNPCFLNKLEEVKSFFDERKHYFQTDFYVWQRKERHLLLDKQNVPQGGKWSFDQENRLPIRGKQSIPPLRFPAVTDVVKEARQYVSSHFSANYGTVDAPFLRRDKNFDLFDVQDHFYPTSFDEAEDFLQFFMKERFAKFGIFEDAMRKDQPVLFHSALSSSLNIGLLTPAQVIKAAMSAAKQNQIPINSLEGFIRQIIGWREFIHIVYEREGSMQRSRNFWGFKRKIPESFWIARTGIEPVDNVISKVLQSGYSHHIERLMVMGNFFLLCEFDPNEVYKWFIELYIDAFDWVMVPNVYGMTQFADGGLMVTKPYISSSNYLLKMGDWEKGPWTKIWDGLFWRFLHVHRDVLKKNARLGILVQKFDQMDDQTKEMHLNNAATFLQSLDC